MARRKSQVQTQFNSIMEEITLLKENLEKMTNQVFSSVDAVTSGDIVQSDTSLILKFELEVFKKLIDINYELECLIQNNPLAMLNIAEKQFLPEVKKINIEQAMNSDVQQETAESTTLTSELVPENRSFETESETNLVVNQEADEPCVATECKTLLNISTCDTKLVEVLPETDTSIESDLIVLTSESNSCTQSIFSEADIEDLRNTLKKFTEKFKSNGFESMKDYCEKPLSSYIDFSFDKKSTISESFSNFEIPEKDTNNTTNAEVKELQLNAETLLSSTNPEVENCLNTFSPIEAEINVEKCSSTENIVFNDADHCPPATIHNDLISSNSMDNEVKPDNSVSKTIVYTALEKLNNTKFFDRREEALKQFIPTNIPDIKLRPTETPAVIKNDLETTSSQGSKKGKKRNKKKKGDGKTEVFYELKPKPAPVLGAECAFSHVESPTEFYIHVVDEESTKIDMLTEVIGSYFKDTISEYESKEVAYNNIGTYCFAFICEYDGWYRAKVLNWDLDSKSDDVLLQLVDYGNKRIANYQNLRKMTKDMADKPMLAIKCHLPLMYPPRSTYMNRLTEWPSESVDALVELSGLILTGAQNNKFFKIVYANQEGDSLAVDLYNPQEVDERQTVGQILLDLGLAVQILENYEEEHMELEVFLQDVDNLEIADNINEAVSGYDPKDEARICRFTRKDGTCFKGKNCKLEHSRLSKDGFTTDTEPVYRAALNELLLPPDGAVVKILITGYKDPCNFYAQIIHIPHKEKSYEMDQTFYLLLQDMNFAKTVKTFEPFRISPAIGEIVIVRHWSKKWLRAVVRERTMWNNDESVEYEVFTVDFGEYLKVTLDDLRKIKPNFLQLPFQAVECYIHNYKTKKNCDLAKAKKFFSENLYFRNFFANIRSAFLPLKVGVKNLADLDVGKVLAEKGFAERRTEDKIPTDDCPLEVC